MASAGGCSSCSARRAWPRAPGARVRRAACRRDEAGAVDGAEERRFQLSVRSSRRRCRSCSPSRCARGPRCTAPRRGRRSRCGRGLTISDGRCARPTCAGARRRWSAAVRARGGVGRHRVGAGEAVSVMAPTLAARPGSWLGRAAHGPRIRRPPKLPSRDTADPARPGRTLMEGTREDRASAGALCARRCENRACCVGPASATRDPINVLEDQGASRIAELVPVRHGRMAPPIRLLPGRGGDGTRPGEHPGHGLRVQACGDAT